jgi:RecB family exonuclease
VTARLVLPTERHLERSVVRGATTTRRFLRELSAADPRRDASTALRSLVARERLRAGSPFGSVHGLAPVADRTVGELLSAGTTAADLRRTGTARGAWLASLLEDLDARLSDLGLRDPRRFPGRETLAASSLRRDGVVLSSALDLDPAFLRFVGELQSTGVGGPVSWQLPLVGDAREAPALAAVASTIEATFADWSAPPELEWLPTTPPTEHTITACSGPEAEAREIAHRVAEALARGASPERVAIVLPGSQPEFDETLRTALEEAGVPYSEAQGPPVFASPEARVVLDLLEMAHDRLDRDALVVLLTTPGLHPGSLVREGDEGRAVARARELASRLARLPVVRDRDGQLMLRALDAALGESDPELRERWMLPALEALATLFAELRQATSIESLTAHLLTTVARLRLGDPSAPELADALAAEGRGGRRLRALEAAAEGAVAVRATTAHLEGLRAAARTLGASESSITPFELAAELRSELATFSTTSRGAASRALAVRVGPVDEVVGLEHDLLVFAGMSTSAYRVRRTQTLLDEATRDRLPPSRRPRAARERALERAALLEWALVSAKSVALTHQATGSDGRPGEPPHPAVLARRARATERREPASRFSRGARTLSERGRELVTIAAGGRAPSAVRDRVAVELDRAAFFRGADVGSAVGLVDVSRVPLAPLARGAASDTAIAATAIDRAVQCPFRFFADRVLRARRTEELVDFHGPLERGTLLHDALLLALEADKAYRGAPDPEARLANVEQTLARELGGREVAPLRAEGVRRTLAEALAVFEAELASTGDRRYDSGEQGFGSRPDDRFPALPIEASDGTVVWVEGRIDRIDVGVDGSSAAVLDYKTGKPNARSIGVTAMQLPLYAAVLRAAGYQEVSAYYVTIGPGGEVASVPSKADEQRFDPARLAEATRRAADAVVQIHRGHVPPRPENPSLCRSCDARGLCRRPATILGAEEEP